MHKLAKFGFSLAITGLLFVWPLAWCADEFGGEDVLLYQPFDAPVVAVNVGSFDPGFDLTEGAPEAQRLTEMRLQIASALGSPTDQSGALTRVVFPNEAHLVKPAEAHPKLEDSLRLADRGLIDLYRKAADGFALYDKRASQPIQAQFVWWLAKMLFIGCGVAAALCFFVARATKPKDTILPD